MNNEEFFKLIPARQFFTKYAPTVKRYYHKTRGIDGNKQPITWTKQDLEDMQAGVKRLSNDLKKFKFK